MKILRTAQEARDWLAALPGVSRETLVKLDVFAAMLEAENAQQNLVAKSTLGNAIWTRHIVDSAQLLPLSPQHGGRWIDCGSGPGLPGLVIAILEPRWHVTLIESRRLRCEFLERVVASLALERQVDVVHGRVEKFRAAPAAVISARAFAPLAPLIAACHHLADKNTTWLLPKGKNAVNELSTLSPSWQTMFHVEPSLTDNDAHILVGHGKFS